MLVTDESTARDFVAARCGSQAIGTLVAFVDALKMANERQNLVASKSLVHVWQRHIADSAQLLDCVSRETGAWIDFGSGAGLPGLVAAIMRPEREFVLIEARKLRFEWLGDTIDRFGITNCRVIGCDVRQAQSQAAAVISARAFAPLPRLIALSARFSTKHTEWVLPKGRSAAQEVANLPERTREMFHVKPSVTDRQAGIIVGKGRVEVAA